MLGKHGYENIFDESKEVSIRKMVGNGCWGNAFLVKNTKSREVLVSKEMGMKKMNEKDLHYARTEVEVMRKLKPHPNIVRFEDSFEDQMSKVLYILMEYADGGILCWAGFATVNDPTHSSHDGACNVCLSSLCQCPDEPSDRQWATSACATAARAHAAVCVFGVVLLPMQWPPPVAKVRNWFNQTCMAVAHLHQHNILHRCALPEATRSPQLHGVSVAGPAWMWSCGAQALGPGLSLAAWEPWKPALGPAPPAKHPASPWVRRDLKAQNIFLSKNGSVKVGDFGVSTLLSEEDPWAKSMCGTPCHWAPEVAQGQPYGDRSDVWALGVLLFQLCTLRLPFNGPTIDKTKQLIIDSRSPELATGASPHLEAILRLMLRKDAKARPSLSQVLEQQYFVHDPAAEEAEQMYQPDFEEDYADDFSSSSSTGSD
eukprot:gene5203-930_t